MAVPGIRQVPDARQRLMASPESQSAWAAVDAGFGAVADVFDECYTAAKTRIAQPDMADFLAAARIIGKLGRGAEPLLAFLEHWPRVITVTGLAQPDILPPVMTAIQRLQKSPNGPAITPLLQTLAAVAERLRTGEALQHYLTLTLDLASRTSGSIHGHQVTEPSPALPDFLRQAPRLLAVVSLAGLKRWIDDGIRLTKHHPEQQRHYFALNAAESRAILQRERAGTLFVDVERRLELTLAALWQDDSPLIPYATAFAAASGVANASVASATAVTATGTLEAPSATTSATAAVPPLKPYLATDGMRLPDVLEAHLGVSGLARYRAMLAHLAGHRRWSQPLIADNWSPMQRLAVETLEDARIDALVLRRFPGLSRSLLALHPAPAAKACDPTSESCLRHRLTCLSRACLDPHHGYDDPHIIDFSQRFHQQLANHESSTQAMAELALMFVTRSRRQSDQLAKLHFTDSDVDYRDDNRHLWTFIESGDEEDSFDRPRAPARAPDSGLPPRHYPEWDARTDNYRPDWVAVYEALHPAGRTAEIDQLLAKHALLARQLKRLLDMLKPQDRVRLRYQDAGSELDLDVALRALIDWKCGHLPDPRIHINQRPNARDISVLLLIDLSQSLNTTLPGSSQSILQTAKEALALLGWAIDQLGDACAIAGFHSNTRHEVRYHHIKGFSETWDTPVKARLAAMEAGWSTRMGAAMRHAGSMLAARRSEKRILLVLTDGEPADIDESDPQYLVADAKKAVETLSTAGITPFCLSLDPKADDYVSHIFGQHWRILDRIERLPEQLPLVYLSLTR